MRLARRLPLPTLSLLSLFLGACATAPKPAPVVAALPPPPASVFLPAKPIVHEGINYRYVERAISGTAAEQEAPYWLTGFENSGRVRVLPADNQGVALVLQAPVAIPKLLVQDQGHDSDRIHVRIVNRGDASLQLAVSCFTRSKPIKHHANLPLEIGAHSMIDLALDTPSQDRANLLLRVR